MDNVDNAETDTIVADYLSGINVLVLARMHRHTNRTISRILREAGVLGTLQRRRDAARRGKPSPAHLRNVAQVCPPEADEWLYIAGLFDGEGSVVARSGSPATSPVREKAATATATTAMGTAVKTLVETVEAMEVEGTHRRYRVSIVQKDVTPLQLIQQQLGVGHIHFANGTHRYEVTGQRAVFAFLRGVLPYLIVKRETAAAALAALATSYGWVLEKREGEVSA